MTGSSASRRRSTERRPPPPKRDFTLRVDAVARYRKPLDPDAVLVVPPVELRSDRTVRQIMVGQSDAFPAAIEALPAAVDVEILWTGAYDRSHAVGMSDR